MKIVDSIQDRGINRVGEILHFVLSFVIVYIIGGDETQKGAFVIFGRKTVHRKALLEVLTEELPKKNIHFSCKIIFISTEVIEGSSITVLQTEDGTVIKMKVLIGCDGVHSWVARWLGLEEPVNSGRFGLRGLSIFPQGHGLDHHATRIVHTSFNGGFVPISDSETWAPLKLRVPWNVIFGKLSKGTITVAGDAMHPMTPELGQGGCCALEDAIILGRCIGNTYLKNGQQLMLSEVSYAIDDYVKARRWRVECYGGKLDPKRIGYSYDHLLGGVPADQTFAGGSSQARRAAWRAQASREEDGCDTRYP
ncbi:monooxygenase 2-like [Apium graveolens]|uniref:monooxygenase 2-like n=1 Tax=Apium graveolens TaxID=4045 RepID=UPI003D7BB860